MQAGNVKVKTKPDSSEINFIGKKKECVCMIFQRH